MQAQEFNPQVVVETTPDAPVSVPVPTSQELPFNQVRLSDGRLVEMREMIGSDEMIVAGQLGGVFEPNGAGAVIFQSCLIVRTIVKVDGMEPPRFRNYEGVRDFLAGFKGKDYTKIKKLFEKLNGDGEGNA
ncbi:hypothetical protein [Tumebacillus flagellatus]|uniref:Phage protein n=1 Tax=Tumebacillus flagellatus TaxID=1157490 RepID=A0A074LR70_9BACL|nr:hypothetical protein [Tumebacillus flagellatus]KEO82995.1 hypothetical protein EL26_11940 [Tumebacillus flagellatus]